MKQALALAVLMMGIAGVATAAEVAGNNTAVVVQPTLPESSTGYMFACVPVNALDITGQSTTATLTLADVLPPANFAGASVTVKGLSATCDGTNWKDGQGTTLDGTKLVAGDTLWIKTAVATTFAADGETVASSGIVFCGQQNATLPTLVNNGQIQTSGNPTSEALPVAVSATDGSATAIFASAPVGAQIFRVEADSAQYTIYQKKSNEKWYQVTNVKGFVAPELTTETLLNAGEGVYYYAPATSAE